MEARFARLGVARLGLALGIAAGAVALESTNESPVAAQVSSSPAQATESPFMKLYMPMAPQRVDLHDLSAPQQQATETPTLTTPSTPVTDTPTVTPTFTETSTPTMTMETPAPTETLRPTPTEIPTVTPFPSASATATELFTPGTPTATATDDCVGCNGTETSTPTQAAGEPCDWDTVVVTTDIEVPVDEIVRTGEADSPKHDQCKGNLQLEADHRWIDMGDMVVDPVTGQLLPKYEYTVKLSNGTQPGFDGEPIAAFYSEPGLRLPVAGGTVRLLDWHRENAEGQWVLDPDALMREEHAFGQRNNPQYPTYDGNVGSNHPLQIGEIGRDEFPRNAVEAARLMGGAPADWLFLGANAWDNDNGGQNPSWKWKMHRPGGRVDLAAPAYNGAYRFWNEVDYPYPWRNGIPQAEEATWDSAPAAAIPAPLPLQNAGVVYEAR